MSDNYDDLITGMEQEESTNEQQQGGGELSKEEFAIKKQAERESLSNLAMKTEMEMVADGGMFRQYLDALANFERYSAQNTLLIFAQRLDATRLGDYDHWKNEGKPVNKDMKAISIFEPGKEYKRDDGTTGVSMNIKKVFDVSQTAARGGQEAASKHDTRTLLKALMSNSPAPIKLVDKLSGDNEGVGVHYFEQSKIIEVEHGLDGNSLFRCLAQEISYAELDNKSTDTFQCNDKGFAAYAAGYALCVKHGVATKGFDFSEVPKIYEGMDGKEVRGEIKTIRDTVNDVATRMARVLNPPEKKAPSQEAR
jgi:hypothetical protein